MLRMLKKARNLSSLQRCKIFFVDILAYDHDPKAKKAKPGWQNILHSHRKAFNIERRGGKQ